LHQISSNEWRDEALVFIGCVPHVDTKGGYADLIRYSKWGGYVISDLNPVPDNWIRNPENILIVHNTLKCIGYKKFIPDSAFRMKMIFSEEFGGMTSFDWEGMSLSQVIDSLINSYNNPSTSYYKQFWDRRKKESNDQAVFFVLNEIKGTYNQSPLVNCNETIVHDTIEKLLCFDLRLQAADGEPEAGLLREYFDYLNSIGLKKSAYNLVMEHFPGKIQADTVIRILSSSPLPVGKKTLSQAVWIEWNKDEGP
jgi:hypothetical protein